jgi:hypothetical protein
MVAGVLGRWEGLKISEAHQGIAMYCRVGYALDIKDDLCWIGG